MTDDFAPIERLAGDLLLQLAPAEKRSLLRRMARAIRDRQSQRIARQQNPDGGAFAARHPPREWKQGNHAVRFLYPKGAANPRVVFMKSWVYQGPLMTGFDVEAGGIRSFFHDRIEKRLPVTAEEENAGAGKLRRKGSIRRKAMFRKLGSKRFLRADASASEAWIGFSERAGEIARIHQEGRMDRVTKNSRQIRYARRGLLGLTERERGLAVDMLLEHVTGN